MQLELNKLYNMDCMNGMELIPDKYFDLAIVDPPYFQGPIWHMACNIAFLCELERIH